MKVQVSRSVLNGFRQRALKKYPLEHLETVWGKISHHAIQVIAFYPVDHTSKPDACIYSPTDIEEQREKEVDFPEGNLKFLGTIHSHPDAAPWPSESDWETAREDGETIMGIFQILPMGKGRKKTKVGFYSDPLQELEVI